jgi:hypothetical protein
MCAFFARPNLDNTQFKQLKGGEPLTLSGQTQIATTSGLTLVGDTGTGTGGGMWIPVIATGASNNYVLTYDSAEQVIKLKESTASGGSTVYTYTGQTTCAVGGLPTGQTLFNDPLVDIIHCMVQPTICPTFTCPSITSFTLSPTTIVYEVGVSASISGTINSSFGSINPVYSPTSSSCRSNGTCCVDYVYFGNLDNDNCFGTFSIITKNFGSATVGPGNNTVSATVTYQGGVQPYDSSGAAYDSPLPSGCTSTSSKNVVGVYPWFWGTFTCSAAAGVGRPNACCIKDIITGGTEGSDYCKEVDYSTGNLDVIFNSTPDDYIWFATPNASTTKTCWYVDATNKGVIGGAVNAGGNLFPAPDTSITDMCSCDGYWSGQTYKIYVSNYQSCATQNMQLRNS